MNNFKTIFALCCVTTFANLFALTVDELKVAYQVQILRVNQEKEDSLDKLRKSYLKSLDKVESSYQKSGRLQDVLQVRKEKELTKSKMWPLTGLGKTAPIDLKNGRRLYERAQTERERKAAKQLISIAGKMEMALNKQIISLTKSGKIKEATAAKELLESTKTDPKLLEAKDFMSRVGQDGSAALAYHLRRFGDGIEVVVSYDKSGKLSMDSPIQNVIEITGVKKERGTTKAKNLGEFVGAKGYEPDPWLVYSNDLVSGKIGALTMTALKTEPSSKTDDGQLGLKIMISPKPVNPHAALANALPPISEAGSYTVSFSYYLPTGNKRIRGFAWHHGFGALIEGKYFEKKGRWTTESISSRSLNEMHHLRLYPAFEEGAGIASAAGESVFLKDLKIEQHAFSAYVVAQYDKQGETTGLFPNSADQKKLILGGSFVPGK